MVDHHLPHPDAERRLFAWFKDRITEPGNVSEKAQQILINAVRQCGLDVTLVPGCGGGDTSPAADHGSLVGRRPHAYLLVAVRLPPGTIVDGRHVDKSFLIGAVPLADLGL